MEERALKQSDKLPERETGNISNRSSSKEQIHEWLRIYVFCLQQETYSEVLAP